jgi:uncharacterized protein (DUF169 family)
MPGDDYAGFDQRLRDLLGLGVPPIAIAFADHLPERVPSFGATHPPPTPDGRTGAVPAGCVFWMDATSRAFATVAADHGNCSVGSYTHGFGPLAEIVGNADVQALLASGWVTAEAAGHLPAVTPAPQAVVYAPLAEAPLAPDIVLLRINGKQLMLLNDAWPELRLEGKPQCHIIPLAKSTGEITLSSGCMLSRVRTGMSNNQITCAIPFPSLPALLQRLERAREADLAVAAYAAEDGKRFS